MGFGEVYMALKTGVIDGQENPLRVIKSSKFYEAAAKYLVLTSHMVDSIISRIPNEEILEEFEARISENRDRGVQEKVASSTDKLILDGEASLVEELQKSGMTVIRPNLEPFRARARHILVIVPSTSGKRELSR